MKLTHRYAEQTDDDLHGRDDHEDIPCVVSAHPIEGLESEPKAEEVFEDEEACKCLDGDTT